MDSRQESRWHLPMRMRVAAFGIAYFALAASLLYVSGPTASHELLKGQGSPPPEEAENDTQLPVQDLPTEPEISERDIAAARAERIELEPGEKVNAVIGSTPQLEWVGEELALIFGVSERVSGLAQRQSGLYVVYSQNGVNWSQPIRLDDWDDDWATGTIIKRQDGSFIVIHAKSYPEGSPRARFFSKTSEDGYTWSAPNLLDVGIEPFLSPCSISATETSDGRLVLAFCHEPEDGMIEICTSTDGMEWELGNPITLGGLGFVSTGIRIAEHDGVLCLAYCDLHEGHGAAYVARMQPNGSWTTVNASGRDYFSFYWGASMAHLANGTTVVAFDHLGATYLSGSRDMVNWQRPVQTPRIGTRPSLIPAGEDSLLVAAEDGEPQIIWVTLIG